VARMAARETWRLTGDLRMRVSMVDFAHSEVAGLLEVVSCSRFRMIDAMSWKAKILWL